jgi:hypothetical protein
MTDYTEGPAGGEAVTEAADAIERACGLPGFKTMATFGAAIVTDGTETFVRTTESLDADWVAFAGGDAVASREVRALLRAWVDAADGQES